MRITTTTTINIMISPSSSSPSPSPSSSSWSSAHTITTQRPLPSPTSSRYSHQSRQRQRENNTRNNSLTNELPNCLPYLPFLRCSPRASCLSKRPHARAANTKLIISTSYSTALESYWPRCLWQPSDKNVSINTNTAFMCRHSSSLLLDLSTIVITMVVIICTSPTIDLLESSSTSWSRVQ